jgi:hypothetical protein
LRKPSMKIGVMKGTRVALLDHRFVASRSHGRVMKPNGATPWRARSVRRRHVEYERSGCAARGHVQGAWRSVQPPHLLDAAQAEARTSRFECRRGGVRSPRSPRKGKPIQQFGMSARGQQKSEVRTASNTCGARRSGSTSVSLTWFSTGPLDAQQLRKALVCWGAGRWQGLFPTEQRGQPNCGTKHPHPLKR